MKSPTSSWTYWFSVFRSECYGRCSYPGTGKRVLEACSFWVVCKLHTTRWALCVTLANVKTFSVCVASIMRLTYIWIPGHTEARTSFPWLPTLPLSNPTNMFRNSEPPTGYGLVNRSTRYRHPLWLPPNLRTLIQESQASPPHPRHHLPELLAKEQQPRNSRLNDQRHHQRILSLL
jgi:hypothetical protein